MKYFLMICVVIFVGNLGAQNEALTLEIKAIGRGKLDRKANPAQAKLMARRAAKIDATRNLLAKIKASMPVYNEPTLENQLEGFIAGVRYAKPVTMEDGSIQVVASLSIDFLLKNYQALYLELSQCHEQAKQSEKEKTVGKSGHGMENLQTKLGKCKKQLANALQTLKTLEARYQEQSKALRSFAKERRQIDNFRQKIAQNKQHLSRQRDLQRDMEKQCLEHSRQLKDELVREKQKVQMLQARNRKQQTSNDKTLELLIRINRDLTDVWLKHQALSEKLRDREAKLLVIREQRIYENEELKQAKQMEQEWRMRYNELWQNCYELLQKEGHQPEECRFMKNLLKRIYMNQRQMKGELGNIKKLLTIDDFDDADFDDADSDDEN